MSRYVVLEPVTYPTEDGKAISRKPSAEGVEIPDDAAATLGDRVRKVEDAPADEVVVEVHATPVARADDPKPVTEAPEAVTEAPETVTPAEETPAPKRRGKSATPGGDDASPQQPHE